MENEEVTKKTIDKIIDEDIETEEHIDEIPTFESTISFVDAQTSKKFIEEHEDA